MGNSKHKFWGDFVGHYNFSAFVNVTHFVSGEHTKKNVSSWNFKYVNIIHFLYNPILARHMSVPLTLTGMGLTLSEDVILPKPKTLAT